MSITLVGIYESGVLKIPHAWNCLRGLPCD